MANSTDWKTASEETLVHGGEEVRLHSPAALARAGLCETDRLPYSVRVLLENLLRNRDGRLVTDEDVKNVAGWRPAGPRPEREVPFMPARVILQDFTGVPVVADLAAMRGAVSRAGGDPGRVNPVVPADLVIDHSVQVDFFGTGDAEERNAAVEFERNRERYAFLKWAQGAFRNLRVLPPGRGIVHQVNLEFLATVIGRRKEGGRWVAHADTVLGTDSHTTMVNGLGVLGWGVGGIEAEAVMLGQPYFMELPDVVGFRLKGGLPEGATATDLVLTVTEQLRRHGVTGKMVEFFGPGLRSLAVQDRTTVANMAPEYGATAGFFPVDGATLAYLRMTGRDGSHLSFVEQCAKRLGLFADSKEPAYTEVLELDMREVEPSIAGPANPEDRIPLRGAKTRVSGILREKAKGGGGPARVRIGGREAEVGDGSITIAAITSCTNTSNPGVMVGAGLVAKRAVERGLRVPAHVKTSLAPGSRVVTDYLRAA
ncbi:MAG: aconitase family protein, partial [Halobacteria archaeon]